MEPRDHRSTDAATQEPSPRSVRRVSRRGYERPMLVEYGPVAKLTQGTMTVSNDGPMGGHRMAMCL